MEPFETFTHAGLTIELHYDDVAGDPFEEYDQAAELVWMNRDQAMKNVDGRVSLDYDHYLDPDRVVSVAHGARYLTLMRGYLVAIPFRFNDYGSSGYQARLTDTDDDRAAGFVCVSKKGIELTGAPDPDAAARQDFETWRQWVEGEVSGYVVKNAEGEVLDSCWGFYGDPDGDDGVKDEAKSSAEYHAKEIAVELEPLDVAEVLARA